MEPFSFLKLLTAEEPRARLHSIGTLETLAIVGLIAMLDIALRQVAFRRVESIGYDVAVFGLVYCSVEALTTNQDIWDWRCFVLVVIVVVAAIVHSSLELQSRRHVKLFVRKYLGDDRGHEAYQQVAANSIFMALSPRKWLDEEGDGKRRRRQAVVDALGELRSQVDTSEVDTSEVDTSEVDISEVDISEVDISEVDISEVDTSEVVVREVVINEKRVDDKDMSEKALLLAESTRYIAWAFFLIVGLAGLIVPVA